ncbi:MAG: LuxR family transcriptional regulator [Bacteroidales bacterium]|nr:LuxR family transcriptional regulator [Bacteroidales bacterium]
MRFSFFKIILFLSYFMFLSGAISGQELDNNQQLKNQIGKLQTDNDVIGVNRILNRNTSLDPEYVLLVITKNLQIANQISDHEALADTYLTKGNFWFFQGNRVKAFDNYFQCEIISRNNRLARLTGLAIMNRSHLVEDSSEKIDMLKEAMVFFEQVGDIVNLSKAHLNTGNAYSSFVLGDTSSQPELLESEAIKDTKSHEVEFYKETAFYHYNIAKELNDSIGHNEVYASLNIRFGQWSKYERNFGQAEVYFKNAHEYFGKAGLLKGQIYANLQLASIKIEKARYREALDLLELAENISLSYSYNDYLVYVYNYFVLVYERQGLFEKALEYKRKYTSSLVNYNELISKDKIHALNLEYTLLEQNRIISEYDQQKKVNRLIIFLTSFLAVFVSLTGYLAVMNKRRKIHAMEKSVEKTRKINEMQRTLMETRMKNQQLQKELLEEKVKIRSESLVLFANQMQKLENFLQTISKGIKSLSGSAESEKFIEKVNFLKLPLTQIIHEQKNLKEISLLSEQANQDFFFYIEKNFDSITKDDKKLLSFLILDMSSKEIGEYLNISTESVHKKRYRLRKKLNIPNNQSFLEFYKNSLIVA